MAETAQQLDAYKPDRCASARLLGSVIRSGNPPFGLKESAACIKRKERHSQELGTQANSRCHFAENFAINRYKNN